MSSIREYVLEHELFCHHDHHRTYSDFDAARASYSYVDLLGYAGADLVSAAGPSLLGTPIDGATTEAWWPMVRTTGYGRAVLMTARVLFDLEYKADRFDDITAALQAYIKGKTAAQLYDVLVHTVSRNTWTLQDGWFRPDSPLLAEGVDALEANGLPDDYPDSYRFAFRFDGLLDMVDAGPIALLERATDTPIHRLDQLVGALYRMIDAFGTTGRLAALKIGMAYQRDLVVGDPTTHEAELAFSRIRSRNTFYDGIQQGNGAVDAQAGRALGDYMFHRMMQYACEHDLPVQIHTGYLAGNWGSLNGTKASNLIPILNKYRTVRFDLFHASWPWTSELGAIAKNYPNVWADMCWAWTMNPTESERALDEWLDGVPYNKIFAYGADTGLPWCNVGYSLQAKLGIARVLDRKVANGFYDLGTAREIADRIMIENGIEFFGLEE